MGRLDSSNTVSINSFTKQCQLSLLYLHAKRIVTPRINRWSMSFHEVNLILGESIRIEGVEHEIVYQLTPSPSLRKRGEQIVIPA